jgi:RES domain-containing protein
MSHADLVGAIDRRPALQWSGQAFRHVAAGRPPLSGEGARLIGGRWNPPRSFPVLYLALSKAAVVGEFHRLAERQRLAPESFLPRTFHTYEAELEALLDLRDEPARAAVGLEDRDLSVNDLGRCQAVGEATYTCNREGIIVPGATGQGEVLAVFIGRLRPSSYVRDIAAELCEQVPAL